MLSATETKELERFATKIERTEPRVASVIRKAIAVRVAPTAGQYATVGQAAKVLQVSDQTVRNWLDSGWLTGIRRGPLRRRLILRSSLDAVQRFDAVQLSSKTTMTEDDAAGLVQQHRRERAKP